MRTIKRTGDMIVISCKDEIRYQDIISREDRTHGNRMTVIWKFVKRSRNRISLFRYYSFYFDHLTLDEKYRNYEISYLSVTRTDEL